MTIASSVTSIESDSFRSCGKLTSIVIPPNVRSIGYMSFYGSSNLESISFPSTLESIGSYAFSYCAFTSVFIPANVSFIGDGPFSSCSNLVSFEVDESNPYYKAYEGVIVDVINGHVVQCPIKKKGKSIVPDFVKSIGVDSFRGCSDLTSIILPSNVTSIGKDAFEGCHSLTSMVIPPGVTSIGEATFHTCWNLASITLPASLTYIGLRAFYDCRKLKSITFPSNLRTIGIWAFDCCTGLKTLTIPSSVTSIDNRAFTSCTSLTSVVYLGTKDPGASSVDVFGGCSSLRHMCVPSVFANDSFCGLNVSSNSEVTDDLINQRNQCYDMVCSDSGISVQKMEYAAWKENQTNGCVEYKCLNESGVVQRGMCKDGEYVCMDESCVRKDSFDNHKWGVVIDVEESDNIYNTTNITASINELSGVNPDEITVVTEINDEGQIVRIIVYVDDKSTADIIVEAVDNLDTNGDCGYGILCLKKSVEVKSLTLSMSGSSSLRISVLFMALHLMLLASIFP